MISEIEITIRLLLGAVLGGIIGFERQTHGRQAGFRTQMLVCIASVLLMIVSEYYQHLSFMNPSYVRVDPGRIAAGAITGVGFLGAGVILKTGATVQGLTTAACLWMVSAIGLSVGAGFYLAGILSCGITLFALLFLRMIEKKMPKLIYRNITITAEDSLDIDTVITQITVPYLHIKNIDYEKDTIKKEITYEINTSLKYSGQIKTILTNLASITSIKKISIKG
ncbi:MAG: MgtC/SapB family protein [Nitrospiraceae bacterium]|nr:MgtC/SapB family protein [Nitrospiraceae bacterium]